MRRILSVLPVMALAVGMTAWAHDHHGKDESKCTGKADCTHDCCKRKQAKKSTTAEQPAASEEKSSGTADKK